uniref:Uncharacterized protein n=1 Tax=Anguilla anguilla TaxID=7936 RepID=A0A0E9WBH4_ANGAN
MFGYLLRDTLSVINTKINNKVHKHHLIDLTTKHASFLGDAGTIFHVCPVALSHSDQTTSTSNNIRWKHFYT